MAGRNAEDPMGWRKARASFGQVVRLAVTLAGAGLAGGCFQPLYGEGALPGSTTVRAGMGSVDAQQTEASAGSSDTKLAVQTRNALIFNFPGGGFPSPPIYRLKIRIGGGRSVIVVDRSSALS